MRRANIAVVASMLELAACSNDDNSRRKNMTEVPSAVQNVIAGEFPTDGKIHVRKQGVFKIEPATLFCEMDVVVDPEIEEVGITGIGIEGTTLSVALEGLGQRTYLDGTSRQRSVRSGQCSDNGLNVVYRGYVQLNREGNPYKLVLAVWQGDPAIAPAIWVGGVERLDGQARPDADFETINPSSNPRFFGKSIKEQKVQALMESSLELDRLELSKKFSDSISGGAR